MSRIANAPVTIPPKVEVSISDLNISISGPMGKLNQFITPNVKLNNDGQAITFAAADESQQANAMAGRLMKMFEKDKPKDKNKLYERAENLVSLINENNNINFNTELLNEMKKIGIEKLSYSYSSLPFWLN